MQYRLLGIDRKTGRTLEPLVVDAPDEESALSAAAKAEMLVQKVDVLHSALHPSPTERDLERRFTRSKYPALETIAAWYRTLAVVCAIAGACGGVAGLASMAAEDAGIAGLVLAGASAIWGTLMFITLVALAEGITLAIDVEATLRQIRDRLPQPTRETPDE